VGYLILLIPVLILLAMIRALIYAYKKLRLKWFLLLVVSLLLVPTAMWKFYERKFSLEVIPDALEVRTVSYRNEESWGFGPGGNEAGILFYPLSEDVSRKVGKAGIEYLEQLPPNEDQQSRDLRGIYDHWSETPIRGDVWKIDPGTGLLNVTDYICNYGYCLDIPSDLLRQANEIVSKPGSFYARGRVGIIVVSPEQKLVLYFYDG
jgi:hypothetical protein